MSFLQEYRCKCGKLLFKGSPKNRRADFQIEIKCRKCGEIKLIDFGNEIKTENKTDNFDVDRREC
jgi:phage FluMu protein Com